ncbi:hypothetical protein Micbo1qcDRAFT_212713 [Microdochium bolleyi]|uniref:ubiquitinyl hydrolase 1 n=1 Tax=Microdochium bolleyi TaxID=196109 RepID=A0A136IWQ8_9PEZI|nr:hypothetical protein Micbo1qcDRAFT_212713 [Microdochium bolleyi]
MESTQASVFTHVALPAQLPQRAEKNVVAIESALVDYLLQAVQIMRGDNKDDHVLEAVQRCLRRCKTLNMGGLLERTRLEAVFRELGNGDFLVLRVAAQNAGILLRINDSSDKQWAIFEFFETSPKREDVLQSETGTLSWAFPGSAISIPKATFHDESFISTLSSFLEQASTESAKHFATYITKAGSSVLENRDTVDPSLITALLAAILNANGQRCQATLLKKKVRDDVCWHNAASPWRRLPYWLVLRVALARFLLITSEGKGEPLYGRLQYKMLQCVLHCLVLDDTQQDVSLANQAHLKSKICRRLYKLDRESAQWPDSVRAEYKVLEARLRPIFDRSINAATNRSMEAWQRDIPGMIKYIPTLPKKAEPEHLRLQLNLSRPELLAAQERFQQESRNPRRSRPSHQTRSDAGQIRDIASLHTKILEQEDALQSLCESLHSEADHDSTGCVRLKAKIIKYMDAVGDHLDGNVELKSSFLLTVFEAWVCLDQIVCREIPLLRDFHPGFHPHMLEVLHLPRYSDMVRAREIQHYLQRRKVSARSDRTIFDDPQNGCFAERYFNEYDDGALMALLLAIRSDAETAKKAKEAQWRELSAQFDILTREYEATACVYVDAKHEHWQCPRCQINKRRNRMEIRAFEDPLPANEVLAKTVIFELLPPKTVAAYRDATWAVWGLCVERKEPGSTPRMCLQDYSELRDFGRVCGSVSLASTTKSFLMTHYATASFPVSLDQVIRPNALRLGYYHAPSKTWPGRTAVSAKLGHHCKLSIPPSSPYACLLAKKTFANGATSGGPSSNEIIASQASCPTNLSAQEFITFQTMMSGKTTRWITILVELASPNLNMSSADSVVLLKHLSAQLGPVEPDDPLRAGIVHCIFQDPSFCQALLRQLRRKLADIKSNWREMHLMEIIVSIGLRISTLAAQYRTSCDWAADAHQLVETSREITLTWMRDLRKAGQDIKDVEATKQNQSYTLWASVLCKRTFAAFLEAMGPDFDSDDLAVLIECCATAHDSMPERVQDLPPILQQSLVSDFKLQYKLKRRVEQAFLQFGEDSLLRAVRQLWLSADLLTNFELDQDDRSWITATVHSTSHQSAQSLQYNSLHGVLLIDGEPLTRLAPEPQNEAILTALFGVQNLRKFPSRMPGMSHALELRKGGYTTHIGFSNGRMIIRAEKGKQVMELMPQHCFHRDTIFDLPAELVDDCFHWLDLRTGILEIRPKYRIWWPHDSHWKIDVHGSVCYRTKGKGLRDVLVDPYSPLFARAARLFSFFEYKRYLTVFQPALYALTVDMKRMQLRWAVNDRNALQSRQLSVQIDFNQDIGTWYGFRSALVCRHIDNPDERSVLVPLLALRALQHESHVWVQGIGTHDASVAYISYSVNSVLGRLDCVAEPVLVYKKAEIHALTSGMMADPLTRRTGAEEAMSILSSGLAQPWTPLGTIPAKILHAIARICPKREWYPEDMKVMQTTSWNPDLACHAQREEYPILVGRILERSTRLSTFRLDNPSTLPPIDHGSIELNLRALRRREKHRRHTDTGLKWTEVADSQYQPRDRPRNHGKFARVFEMTSLLRERPSEMPTCSNLAQLLSEALTITGFREPFDKPIITDRLDVSIRADWGPLVKAVRSMDTFRQMFFVGTIAFGNHNERELLRTLVAFCVFEPLRHLTFPDSPVFSNFRPHLSPQFAVFKKLVEQYKVPAPADPELAEFATNKQKKALRLAREAHERQATEDCEYFARHLLGQWPSAPQPCLSLPERTFLLDIPAAYASVLSEWDELYTNRQLSLYLDSVQCILNARSSNRVTVGRLDFHPTDAEYSRCVTHGHGNPVLSGVLAAMGVEILTSVPEVTVVQSVQSDAMVLRPKTKRTTQAPPTQAEEELLAIIETLSNSASLVQHNYAADLRRSLEAFAGSSMQQNSRTNSATTRTLRSLNLRTMKIFEDVLQGTLSPSHHFSSNQVHWLQAGQLWPVVSTITLLEQLRSTRDSKIDGVAKSQIIAFGRSITDLQRALRMEKHEKAGDATRWQEEHRNPGHSKWDPADYPDWLLLEIESDILIRDEQFEVAQAIIAPQSGQSSVLQLNMGQGKTSCIIPMVATVLADTDNLVRVCVPKALLQQTAQLLQTRLGGLVGRRMGHVPFSRRTPTDESTIKQFHRLHVGLQKDRGVMICLPEHQLSFALSTSQRILDDRVPEARLMARVQKWFHAHARDVLDESDHTLAVRTQLIYPSGAQTAVDGHPHRWLVAEQLLALVELQLDELQHRFPRSIEVVRREAGGFPYVFFLRTDVEEELIRRLTIDICRGHRGILPVESLGVADRLAVKEFLSSVHVRQTTLERISGLCPDQAHIRSTILVLRGLLVHRILLMALKKRYGVTYGLHEARDPVAVPFHAKGVPSDTSEFGHVDVSILLTCLAFYHRGLTTNQVREALGSVLKSDDPAAIYDNWCDHEGFPHHLKDWHAINAGDERQIADIHQFVQFKVLVIDFYLNNFVFPRHAKQFKVKLQSSGWDIPLLTADTIKGPQAGFSKTGRHLTTGFSGTNDIKPLLPLTISQDDIPSLLRTNAEVLSYLLQPRSRGYEVMRHRSGKRLTESDFLYMLKTYRYNGIRILIDSGAQILEMTNAELVSKWLRMDGRASAALYFDGDRPFIMSKTGTKMPLSASPYVDNLKEVLVYLDEAHTRGTDLRFDKNAHAALTLGLGQTKDHTVQAAMRLRQLGTTQSVTFFAPVEVDQSIRDLSQKHPGDALNSSDVIKWLVHNTCTLTESLQPLYYAQGMDFCQRMQAAIEHPDFLSDATDRQDYVRVIKQTERQTLQQLYAPQSKTRTKADKSRAALTGVLDDYKKELNQRRRRFQDNGHAVHASALEEVEQEREIEQEVEAVRQVKKPLPCTPFGFAGLHRDVENFARTGRFPAGSDIFIPALAFVSKTFTGRKYKVNPKAGSSKLYVSTEFTRTVKAEVVSTNDNFIRPVQWILYSPEPEVAVAVTPEEAECLIPILRKHRGRKDNDDLPATYLLTYSGPTTRRMRATVGSFKFYSIPALPQSWTPPSWLKIEVGLLAGRLYFDWAEYSEVCSFLGITAQGQGINDDYDDLEGLTNFDSSELDPASSSVDPTSGSEREQIRQRPSELSPKPFSFVKEWLSIRRRGQEFSHSPMGFLCLRKQLHADHVFFEKTDLSVRLQDLRPGTSLGLPQFDGMGDEEAEAAAAGPAPDEIDFGEHDPAAALRDDDVHVKIDYNDEDDLARLADDDDEDDEHVGGNAEERRRRSGRGRGSRRH